MSSAVILINRKVDKGPIYTRFKKLHIGIVNGLSLSPLCMGDAAGLFLIVNDRVGTSIVPSSYVLVCKDYVQI